MYEGEYKAGNDYVMSGNSASVSYENKVVSSYSMSRNTYSSSKCNPCTGCGYCGGR